MKFLLCAIFVIVAIHFLMDFYQDYPSLTGFVDQTVLCK